MCALLVGGILALIVVAIWGFVLCADVINEVAGYWGIVVGVAFFPLTLIATPWYAGAALDNWIPLLVCYGGGITAVIPLAIGLALGESADERARMRIRRDSEMKLKNAGRRPPPSS